MLPSSQQRRLQPARQIRGHRAAAEIRVEEADDVRRRAHRQQIAIRHRSVKPADHDREHQRVPREIERACSGPSARETVGSRHRCSAAASAGNGTRRRISAKIASVQHAPRRCGRAAMRSRLSTRPHLEQVRGGSRARSAAEPVPRPTIPHAPRTIGDRRARRLAHDDFRGAGNLVGQRDRAASSRRP